MESPNLLELHSMSAPFLSFTSCPLSTGDTPLEDPWLAALEWLCVLVCLLCSTGSSSSVGTVFTDLCTPGAWNGAGAQSVFA